jgi:hypothetical protein
MIPKSVSIGKVRVLTKEIQGMKHGTHDKGKWIKVSGKTPISAKRLFL